MTNCVLNLLRAIWSFIVGSLRMILFFGCLLLVLFQLVGLCISISLSSSDIFTHYPGGDLGVAGFIHPVAILALGLLGCYGAFYKHHPSIKAFTILIGVSALMISMALAYGMTPQSIQRETDKLMDDLKTNMNHYDWTGDHQDEESYRIATRNWDGLQRLFCCGVKGPEDWSKYRPSKLDSDLYPKSCCLHPEMKLSIFSSNGLVCSKDNPTIAKIGCEERIFEVGIYTAITLGVYVLFQLVLCIVAYIVGYCGSSPVQAPSAGESSHSFLPNQQYQRLDTSVYIRPSPTNQQYQITEKPQLYPSAQDVEKNSNYTAPPPSYGTSP